VSPLTGINHVAMVTGDLDRFRRFYEDVVGLDVALVLRGGGPALRRHAVLLAGPTAVHAYEQPGYHPDGHGIRSDTMFERGRVDHFGFTVTSEASLIELSELLVAAGATDGIVRELGPTLSVHYRDPDGFHGEINCFNPRFQPNTLDRDIEEIGDPAWLERARIAMTTPQRGRT
jgi:catechol 2,3-dioxygenase-like lactoylglutathione lyase family enzyme